jgi:hypothetical protein
MKAEPRYLCSHLVVLIVGDRDQCVNLEEIWESGAVVECEEAVVTGVSADILADDIVFSGRVIAVERHEFAWRAEIAFCAHTLWSMERWRPEHSLDPQELNGGT